MDIAPASRAARRLHARIQRFDDFLFDRSTRVGAVADVALPITNAADHAALWVAVGGGLVATGRTRLALHALATVAVTSFVANQAGKRLVDRPRPDRMQVPVSRRTPFKDSSSFPSGHTASAAAFCVVAGTRWHTIRWPLAGVSCAVAASRVFTGAHFPSDVVAGAAIGGLIGVLSIPIVPGFADRRHHHR